MKAKKGQFVQLQSAAVGLAIFIVAIVVGFLIMSQVKSQIQTIEGINSSGQNGSGIYTSEAFNGTSTIQGSMDDLAGWTPLIVTIVAASVILGLVMLFRRGR